MSKYLFLLIALAAGALQGLSFAPANSWLQLGAIAVLFYLFSKARSVKFGFLLGFLFGLSWFSTSVSWLYVSVHDYGYQPAIFSAFVVLAFSAYLAVYPGLAGALCGWLRKRGASDGILLLAALPAVWGISEWLRGWILSGFPWSASAYAHVDGFLSVLAPLCGADGINYFAALVSASAVCILINVRRPKNLVPPCLSIIFIASLCFVLFQKQWSEPYKEQSIRLIQGGIEQNEKFSPMGSLKSFERYVQLMDEEGLNPDSVIVLPETIFPIPLTHLRPEIWQTFTAVTKSGPSLLFGGFLIDGKDIRNTTVLVRNQKIVQSYTKKHLVPFGEFVPFGFRWFIDLLSIPMGDLTRGTTDQELFEVHGIKMAPLLCYEDLFASEIRDWWTKDSSPNLLVNLSNLGWFGDTWALPQHLNISRMRAMEFARPVVRATNTGVTAYVNSQGQTLAELPVMKPGKLDVTVVTAKGSPTPYASYGAIPWLTAMAILLLAAILGVESRKIRPQPLK